MKSVFKATVLSLALCASLPAMAFQQETHRRIAMDAVTFMKNNPDKTNFAKLQAGLAKAGITVDQFATAMGQGAYDVDDFADTYLCGATTGSALAASRLQVQGRHRSPDVHHQRRHTRRQNLETVAEQHHDIGADQRFAQRCDLCHAGDRGTTRRSIPPAHGMAGTSQVPRHGRAHRAESEERNAAHGITIRQQPHVGERSGAPGGTRTHDL